MDRGKLYWGRIASSFFVSLFRWIGGTFAREEELVLFLFLVLSWIGGTFTGEE